MKMGVINISVKVMLVVGDPEMEDYISGLNDVTVVDRDDNDIDLIKDLLEYEQADFVIINTLLSKRKSIKLAQYVHEHKHEDANYPKIIAIVDSKEANNFLATLAGFGVNAIVPLHQIQDISLYLKNYPEEFDYSRLRPPDKKDRTDAPSSAANIKGTISIAIFNLAHGAGATTLAIRLAEKIGNCGYQAACVNLDPKNDMKYAKTSKRIALFSADPGGQSTLLQALYGDNQYPFIVQDFGALFHVGDDGNITDINQESISDFFRCNYKMAVGFAAPWHIRDYEFLLRSELFRKTVDLGELKVIASGEERYLREVMEDYHELEITDREETDALIDHFLVQIGIKSGWDVDSTYTDGSRLDGFLHKVKRRIGEARR